MYDNEVKTIAYQIDPQCWESYSGKPKQIKRVIEARRKLALESAQKQFNELKETLEEL